MRKYYRPRVIECKVHFNIGQGVYEGLSTSDKSKMRIAGFGYRLGNGSWPGCVHIVEGGALRGIQMVKSITIHS